MTTDTYLHRLRRLRDVYLPIVRETERVRGAIETYRKFESYDECGTWRCLAGEYCHGEYGDPLPSDALPDPVDCSSAYATLGLHFGIDKKQAIALFGVVRRAAVETGGPGDTEARARLLDRLIAEREGEVRS